MSLWTDRQVFVTGATGFVGAHIVKGLVERGAHVVCLQRDEVNTNALDLFDLRRLVTVVSGKVEDFELMLRVLSEYRIESIFHLAAQALVGSTRHSALSTFESNIRGTYTLLEACRQNATVKSIVVASSDKAYGTSPKLPYNEDDPLSGLFPYDASKACTDIVARSYAHSYELPVAVTRCANIFGPGDMNLSRVIPGTVLAVLRDQTPVVRSDGTPYRDFIYVDDVVRAYLALAEQIESARGEAFNFGSGSPVQILDLVNRIIKLAGKEGSISPQVMLQKKIAGEIDAQYLSSQKAETRLGWKAEVTLDDGLQRTIDWYRSYESRG
ncbi:MAG: GDP-mannose 4,6-dehydratase [Acidobacteriota bacterium]|nr:GDP-mannose 4,6-dehydratase [Acidobacteriota bacterium]